MRRELFAAASVLVLMTGGAFAQSSGSTTTGGTGSTMSSTTHSGQLASTEKMLGKSVVGQDGNNIGEVEDVILDPTSGQARQLVISSGGFLGIGAKQIAVDFNQAKWNQDTDKIQLSGLTREDVRNMAEFEYSDSMTSLNRPHKSGTGTGTTGTTTTPATPGASGGSTGTMTTPSPQ
ncbi:sporulation protein YlmC with PRC-barrel domain [Azospirillum fermentarium]|uniref:PRC-barrel domain-containing protein n=1 Tax=Azospirillum fermentarium TaxID=1233114 RepID=UPI00222644CF|nr:PRC-barrel domain-containing protein [Azospirillum fermentarium]MCW2246788.1 sporulation protein YlmC with PRC-barrel domain [Azospirillum fermentarium]